MTPKAPPVRISKQGLEIGDIRISPEAVSRSFAVEVKETHTLLTVTFICSSVEVDPELADEAQGEPTNDPR